MTTLSVAWFLLFATVAAGIYATLFLKLRAQLNGNSPTTLLLLVGAILAAGLLLLRPHEDTFTGLDTSCYRLMGQAFGGGRQLHDVDQTLLEIPSHLRRSVLLEYQAWGRDTRDRSFQLTSIKDGAIQPYFYPFLPMAAAGLGLLSHSQAGDYFVPIVGLLVCSLILITGTALGSKYGLLTSTALLIGTPLPAYLFRGYFAESVAAGLVGMVLLGLTLSVQNRLFRALAPFAIGLAVCFHPVAIVLSLPALIMILIEPSLSRRGLLWNLAGFALGLAPLWAMTAWGCQPYGNIVDWNTFVSRLSAQPLQQLLAGLIVIFLLGLAILLLGPDSFKLRLTSTLHRALSNRAIFLVLLVLAISPLAIPPSLWSGKSLVMAGLGEYWQGVRWGYGLVLLAGLLATFWIQDKSRSRALLLLAGLLASFFFYLKGFEPMGLWSQRRLIPLTLLLIIALTPVLATACRICADQAGRIPATLISGILLVGGFINILLWPAPYLARHEQGTTQWVSSFSRNIGHRLTFFDYYPYSVPFAASGKSRVIGLGEFGYEALPGLSKWLAERASREEVLWVSAFSNPGLEDGVILQSIEHQTAGFERIVSKTALPAECRKFIVEVDIMRGIPITNTSTLAVRKILDDGPLALRGPWGRRGAINHNGTLLPARWSREGSGIIGPIPSKGHAVRITLAAAASRDDGRAGQVLTLHPPWSGPGLSLAISNTFTEVSGILFRPADTTNAAPTGTYTISAESPYNPAKAGIRGYPKDLGARIHRITIAIEKDL